MTNKTTNYKKIAIKIIAWVLCSIVFIINMSRFTFDIYGFLFIVYMIMYGYVTRMFHEAIEQVFPTRKNDNPPNSGELE
jgi:uncharacterized membrane protein